jgi:hypothetical protein
MTKFEASVRLDTPSMVLALNPEVPPGLTSFSVSARQPNGVTTPLLLVRDALPEWPTPYVLKTPLRFPAGTEIFVAHHFAGDSGMPVPEQIKLVVSAVTGITPNTTR